MVVKERNIYSSVEIRVIPRVTKDHWFNPLHFLVSLQVGYIFSEIHWIVIIKQNSLFCNIVLKVYLSHLIVELWFADSLKNKSNYLLMSITIWKFLYITLLYNTTSNISVVLNTFHPCNITFYSSILNMRKFKRYLSCNCGLHYRN